MLLLPRVNSWILSAFTAWLIGLCLVLPDYAKAQLAVFSANEYGRANLKLPESTGDAAAYIAAQKGAFEPVREFPEYDPIRQRARAIGRIDLLVETDNGSRAMSTCTGSVLPDGWVLTNYHCIPGVDGRRLLKASILLDYLTPDGEGSERYEISTEPVEADADLDFSLVRAKQTPDPKYGMVTFRSQSIRAGEPLLVIHHPLGRPKVMTRFRCFAADGSADPSIVYHRCDTMPGSSGSILFTRSLEPVLLHHSGGMRPEDDKSYNKGTSFEVILRVSELLNRFKPDDGANPASADAPASSGTSRSVETGTTGANGTRRMSTGEINTLLRGN